MQKTLDPKVVVGILAIVVLGIVIFGWKRVLAPKSGQEAPPPYSTMPTRPFSAAGASQPAGQDRRDPLAPHRKISDPTQ